MNDREIQRRLVERESRYPGWQPLPADHQVHIHVDRGYAETYAGQVAAITAASLFGRMSRSVEIEAPSVPVLTPLPWEGAKLDEIVKGTLDAVHRPGKDQLSAGRKSLRVVIGPRGEGLVAHGSRWGAYRGNGPSPFAESDEPNPFGAAFAVIMAAAQLQMDPQPTAIESVSVDTYLWKAGLPPTTAPEMSRGFEVGEVWSVGVGSVGSCALFFLSLITRAFQAVLVDADKVKVENVTRSALFSLQDAVQKIAKVEAARRWLDEVGVERIDPYGVWLDEIPDRWLRRQAGTPDILISAANEWNVRSVIESAYPPLQVYATTGRNYQATLFRHIPLRDACSRCVPGAEAPGPPPLCATGSAAAPSDKGAERDDVALLRSRANDRRRDRQARSHEERREVKSGVFRAPHARPVPKRGAQPEGRMRVRTAQRR